MQVEVGSAGVCGVGSGCANLTDGGVAAGARKALTRRQIVIDKCHFLLFFLHLSIAANWI